MLFEQKSPPKGLYHDNELFLLIVILWIGRRVELREQCFKHYGLIVLKTWGHSHLRNWEFLVYFQKVPLNCITCRGPITVAMLQSIWLHGHTLTNSWIHNCTNSEHSQYPGKYCDLNTHYIKVQSLASGRYQLSQWKSFCHAKRPESSIFLHHTPTWWSWGVRVYYEWDNTEPFSVIHQLNIMHPVLSWFS